MTTGLWTLVILALAAATAAPAQAPAMRKLDVPANASWKHARTELILPSRVNGLVRTGIDDTGRDELDVIADFRSPDGELTATLYLFRSQVPSAPLWFDRSRAVVEQLRAMPVDVSAALPVRNLSLSSQSAAAGLQIVYPVRGGGHSSTALAVAPMNGWIVKLRMSARSLAPAALEARMGEWLSAVRWPKPAGPAAPAAVPVAPCAAPLTFSKARMIKPQIEQALLGSLSAVAAAAKPPQQDVRYCREPQQSVNYGVYRQDGSSGRYLIALADSGNALSVAPSLDFKTNKPTVSMTMLELGHTRVLPSYNRLPAPAQVIAALPKMQPLASVAVGTHTVDIHGTALKN